METSPFDQVMQLNIHGHKEAAVLGPAITSCIFVEIL